MLDRASCYFSGEAEEIWKTAAFDEAMRSDD